MRNWSGSARPREICAGTQDDRPVLRSAIPNLCIEVLLCNAESRYAVTSSLPYQPFKEITAVEFIRRGHRLPSRELRITLSSRVYRPRKYGHGSLAR